MKKNLIPVMGAAWLLFTGCGAPSYIQVAEQRGLTSPYTNIMVIYLDEPCNFSLADSTGYAICLKGWFDDSNKVTIRTRMETMVASNLATRGTAVMKSSDLLGVNIDNSYTYFRRLVDSLHIDGILLIQMSHRTIQQYETVGTAMPAGNHGSLTTGFTPGVEIGVADADFDCLLINSRDLHIPVWKAQVGTKGATSQHQLNRSMTLVLVKNLVSAGYIVH